jgi:outer membrane autotransporter protein
LQGLGAAVEPGEHGTWIRAQGHQGSFKGYANAAGADYRGGGFSLGVDTAVGNAATLGLSASYTLMAALRSTARSSPGIACGWRPA